MKLYEFTVTDNLNLMEHEIVERAMQSLDYEAQLQGWAEGYKLEQGKKPVRLPSGETQYFFAVQGTFADQQSASSDDSSASKGRGQSDVAARPDAEI